MTIAEKKKEFETFFLKEFGQLYTNLRLLESGIEKALFMKEHDARGEKYLIREVEFCWKTWCHQEAKHEKQ